MFLGTAFLLEIFVGWFEWFSLTATSTSTAIFALFGFIYFFAVTLGVIYLKSEKFVVNPLRLFRDIAISIGFSVVAFALYYRTAGILPTFGDTLVQPRDYLYFSVVTFSTLGYGDFRPSPDARILAAAQALLGTIHIGMIVGASFLTFSQGNAKGSGN